MDQYLPPGYLLALTALGLLGFAIWSIVAPDRANRSQKRLQNWLNWENYSQFSDQPSDRDPRLATSFYNRFPALLTLERTLEQIGSRYTPLTFIRFIAMLTCLSFVAVWILTGDIILGIAGAIVAVIAPWIWLQYNRRHYLDKFERQLPNALDMLARGLWAGNTLQASMRMIGEDFEPPVSLEFKRTFELVDFGVSIPVALEDMARHVDCPELRYFVTSVLVQRETGGNLAEIVERTASLIHARLEFRDHVKALSAEGRLSAKILFVLPFFIIGFVYWRSPQHFEILFETTIGQWALGGSTVLMLIGYFIIKQMSNKV